ncbi:TIM barrel protein [Oricola sp.]|uniref:sugar phosphate isomerase/epimerase family protein n=1 Tax=Oricola sp. TaxID=1979950 RepID=UPI0025F5F139|nr:TIM barrel protein [Oricola sp.]MCI5077330.1 sugar phosphate isomerase/epimerase [Oricola sp.]
MTRSYCLSYMTLELSPPEAIRLAADAGYDSVGIRMMPALPGGQAFPLMDDRRLMRETERCLEETGLSIFDVEIARIGEHSEVEAWLPMLQAAARLRARTVIAAGADPDESRMTDTFAALCEAAAPFGLSVNLEFTPWSPLRNAAAAARVVAAADQPNGEILIDTIHVARSNTTLNDLRAIPTERMSYFQICDCPAEPAKTLEDLLHTAREERLLPGEGGADLAGIIGALPESLTVSVEIPSHRRISLQGHAAWARTCLDASRTAMEGFDMKRNRAPEAPD